MKKILLVIFLFFVIIDVNAQKKKDTLNICRKGSYLVFDIGGGLHTLNYKLGNYGSKFPGVGLTGRVGYRYFFGKGNFGIGFDANLKTYGALGKFSYVNQIPDAVDSDLENYTHRTFYHNLKEKQNDMILNLPVGLFYQRKLLKKFKIGGGLGVVYQYVISDKYKLKSGELETRGFYEKYNLELYGMDQHYFYKRNYSELKNGENNLKNSFGAFLELNFCYVLTPKLDLNFGVYYVQGFKNQSAQKENYQFDPHCMSPDDYNDVYNGVLNSKVVDKVTPLAIGFNAGLRYRFSGQKKAKPIHDKPIEKPDTTFIPVIADNPTTNPDLIPNKDTTPEITDTLTVVVVDTPPIIEDKPVVEDIPSKEEKPVIEDKPTIEDTPVVEDKTTKEDNPIIADNNPKNNETDSDLEKREFVALNFDYNKSFIRQRTDYSDFFNEIANIAKNNTDYKIKIVGHTCDLGKQEDNIRLGLKRAQAAKRQLIDRKIDANRIICESMGEKKPLFPNTSDENRAKNRRVEIKFVR